MGDNVPENAYAIAPAVLRGFANEAKQERLVAKFVDRHGAPVSGQPVEFAVLAGRARILSAQPVTDAYGLASAVVQFAGSPGQQAVAAYVGGAQVRFDYRADLLRPRIDAIVNDASLAEGQPVAPGSLVSIFGSGLAEFEGEALLSPLPAALKSVSVSFDFPELRVSEPARVFSTSAGRLVVQVPWELAGINFAFAKVRVRNRDAVELTSDPFVVNLADVSPGIYAFDLGGGRAASAFHDDGRPVTPADPAAAGSRVTLYLSGAGPHYGLDLQSGVAPVEPLETMHAPVVTVGGSQAAVVRSVSSPGAAGMSQIEFVVPHGLPRGAAGLTVSIDGVRSNAAWLDLR